MVIGRKQRPLTSPPYLSTRPARDRRLSRSEKTTLDPPSRLPARALRHHRRFDFGLPLHAEGGDRGGHRRDLRFEASQTRTPTPPGDPRLFDAPPGRRTNDARRHHHHLVPPVHTGKVAGMPTDRWTTRYRTKNSSTATRELPHATNNSSMATRGRVPLPVLPVRHLKCWIQKCWILSTARSPRVPVPPPPQGRQFPVSPR